jgi:hypothetical protein
VVTVEQLRDALDEMPPAAAVVLDDDWERRVISGVGQESNNVVTLEYA